jgi:hypothetical protein
LWRAIRPNRPKTSQGRPNFNIENALRLTTALRSSPARITLAAVDTRDFPMSSRQGADPSETARQRARADRISDLLAVLLVFSITAIAAYMTPIVVEEYRWQQAARVAFYARQTAPAIPVQPLFDRAAHERFIDQAAGSVAILAIEGFLVVWFGNGRLADRRRERQTRKAAARRQRPVAVTANPVVVEEAWHPTPSPAAAERAAIVVWGDRVAQHEREPSRA